jgi:hypothetical protein
MIAHADLAKPPAIKACGSVRTAAPCYATIRTLLPSGAYRYHRITVTYKGSQGFVSSLAKATP